MTPTDLIAAYNALPAAGQAQVRRHILAGATAPAAEGRRRRQQARLARVQSLVELHGLSTSTLADFRALIRHLEASDYTLGETNARGYRGKPLDAAYLRRAYHAWQGAVITSTKPTENQNVTLTASTAVATTPITTHSVVG